jgi:hypothetical protein
VGLHFFFSVLDLVPDITNCSYTGVRIDKPDGEIDLIVPPHDLDLGIKVGLF